MKKVLLAIGVLAVIGAAVVAYVAIDPFSDDSDPTKPLDISGTACQRLAGLADHLAEANKSPHSFLVALGLNGAGIHTGTRGLADLLRGGHNRIPGTGFRERYDDGTQGQVRHFTGITTATLYAKGDPTLWISRHLRHDKKGSADDNLTEQGIAFATGVQNGTIPLDQTGEWILGHICRRHA